MTDIDTQADIELHSGDGQVTVSVPLAGAVTGEWLRCYQQLALATKLPAAVQARQDRAWMVVSVPATSDQGEVTAAMDAARALIAEADAAERSPANAKVEASVRAWWAGRKGNAPSSPVAEPGSVRTEVEAGVKAEQRWPMACTLVVATGRAAAAPAQVQPGSALGGPGAGGSAAGGHHRHRSRSHRPPVGGWPGAVPGAGLGADRRCGWGQRPAGRRPHRGRSGNQFGGGSAQDRLPGLALHDHRLHPPLLGAGRRRS